MNMQDAFAGLRSAIQQGADVPQFVKATVKTRADAESVGSALSHIADFALSGTKVSTTPEHQTLFRLVGSARKMYLQGMTDDQLGHAVGQLAIAVGQVQGRVKFDAPTAPPPLQVAIVAQPVTETTSEVTRDDTGKITTTRQTTRPV